MKRSTVFVLSVLVFYLLIGASNLMVDPLQKIYFSGFGPYFSSEREFKVQIFKKYHPRVTIIGSSVSTAINPRLSIRLNESQKAKIMNASFSAGMPEEFVAFVRKNAPNTKAVLIGLDFGMFNESWVRYKSSDQCQIGESSNPFEKIAYALTFDTVIFSLRALVMNLRGIPPLFDVNGGRLKGFGVPYNSGEKVEHDRVLYELEHVHYNKFVLSENRVDELLKFSHELKSKSKQVVLFLNPLSFPVLELISKTPNANYALIQLRGKLSSLFSHDFLDLSHVKDLSDLKCFFKDDPLHYTRECGALILDEVLKKIDWSPI